MKKAVNPNWPKVLPPLTPDPVRTGNVFTEHRGQPWAARFVIIETFNHGCAVKRRLPDLVRPRKAGGRVRRAPAGAVRHSGGGGAARAGCAAPDLPPGRGGPGEGAAPGGPA